MKSLILIFSIILIGNEVLAQSPQSFTYQAVARDLSGNILANKNLNFKISILKTSIAGTIVYSEIHSVTTNAFGLVSLEIGSGNFSSGSLSEVKWGDNIHFLKVEMDSTGGTAYQIMGVSQLLSVPYALYAKDVQNKDDSDADSTNEVQTLSLDSNKLTISGTGGNYVTFENWDTNEANDVDISGDQTITGNKTFSGTITVQRPINATDAANKAYVDSIKDMIYNEFLDAGLNGIVKDIDGNIYPTKRIGSQVWMCKNLATFSLNDGSPIVGVSGSSKWINLYYAGFCFYNDSIEYMASYGILYNRLAVNSGKLCPKGWHVPKDSEWKQLEMTLGMTFVQVNIEGFRGSDQGTQMKNSSGWRNSGNGSNSSGFTALPGGYREWDGVFFENGLSGMWWSSSSHDIGNGNWCRQLNSYAPTVGRILGIDGLGLSVRCIRDL